MDHLPAGHGATLNIDGEVELDAIIMDGRTLACGAVSSVKNIANPVTLARAVMEKVTLLMHESSGLNVKRLFSVQTMNGALFAPHTTLKTLDGARDADGQRCKPVRRERRRGRRPHGGAGDGVREEGVAEAQELRDWGEGGLQLSVVSGCTAQLFLDFYLTFSFLAQVS